MTDMLHNKRRKSKGEKLCCCQRFTCKKCCKRAAHDEHESWSGVRQDLHDFSWWTR